jgi:acyl-CoA thioesterase I
MISSKLLAAMLLSCCTLSAQQLLPLDTELRKVWPSNRTINIVFHGHSVPSGYHLTPAVKPFESYPHLFRKRIAERYPFAVINVITTGIGGENSIAGAARFRSDVLSRKPDLIFIDYALNDRPQALATVEAAWRSMVDAAQAANVPVMLLTPTGANNANLADPADPLTQRAALIRTIATSEGVLLGDVSADWLAALTAGTAQSTLLSQGNHPNLAGHQIAANRIFTAFSAATATQTIPASDFLRNKTTGTHTTADSLLTFTTTNTFSGLNGDLGDSGGASDLSEVYNGTETLQITLAASAQLTNFRLRNTVATLTITGFLTDPGARIGTVNNAPGISAWNAANQTLTLTIPADAGHGRQVTFSNPAASLGKTLNFSFSANGSGTHQAAFTSFTRQSTAP